MSDHGIVPCHGPYGGEGADAAGSECSDPAVFEVSRHQRVPLRVCPVHLGPSLLMAAGVLWPPVITVVGRA